MHRIRASWVRGFAFAVLAAILVPSWILAGDPGGTCQCDGRGVLTVSNRIRLTDDVTLAPHVGGQGLTVRRERDGLNRLSLLRTDAFSGVGPIALFRGEGYSDAGSSVDFGSLAFYQVSNADGSEVGQMRISLPRGGPNPIETARLTQDGTLVLGSLLSGHPRAALQVNSTTQVLLPPRMTTAQRDAITNPPEGSEIYNLDAHTPQFYDGTTWRVHPVSY